MTSAHIVDDLLAGTVRVLSQSLYYAPNIGVGGSIWFEGCIMENCMNEVVTISFEVDSIQSSQKLPTTRVLRTTQVIPGLLPFPVNGLLEYRHPFAPGVRKYVKMYYGPDRELMKEIILEEGELPPGPLEAILVILIVAY